MRYMRGRMGFGRAIVIFALGAFSGIYFDRQYRIPRMEAAREHWCKVQEKALQYKKTDSDPALPTGVV